MPTFDSLSGPAVFIPAPRILMAEAGEGGLSTVVSFASPFKAGAVGQVEVKHTTAQVGELIVRELERVR